jgi:hypothetical protein
MEDYLAPLRNYIAFSIAWAFAGAFFLQIGSRLVLRRKFGYWRSYIISLLQNLAEMVAIVLCNLVVEAIPLESAGPSLVAAFLTKTLILYEFLNGGDKSYASALKIMGIAYLISMVLVGIFGQVLSMVILSAR